MKKIIYGLLCLTLFVTSCGSDDDTDPTTVDADLHHDGLNQTAPSLPAGIHDLGTRFTSNETAAFDGKQLDEVEYYLLNKPTKCEVRVYGEGSASQPGSLLYSADVTDNARAGTWSRHSITSPVDITGSDLWIVIHVEHDAATQSLGCDFGPAVANGDWITTDNNSTWQTFRDYTNQEANINWNIRGQVSE